MLVRVGARTERFGESEIEDLHRAVRPPLDVRGLQIAMDDALGVRCLERVGDLTGDVQRFGDRQRPARQPLGEVLARDELHHERLEPVHLLEPVDHADVWMVQRGEHPCLAFEAHDVFGIVSERAREDLDGYVASQPGVARAIHLAHPAGTDQSWISNAPSRRRSSSARAAAGPRGPAGSLRSEVEAQQRLDFDAKRRLDVHAPRSRPRAGGRPVGQLAKQRNRVGIHGPIGGGQSMGRHTIRRARSSCHR